MSTQYTYASARIKALESSLLNETQRERLFGAKTTSEAFTVLEDTFVAPYLTEHQNTPLGPALDAIIADTQKLLARIAPDPELLHILWLKYDFANLRAIIKGKRAHWSDEDILAQAFRAGAYEPEKLLAAYTDGKLAVYNSHLARAAEKADSAQHIFDIDLATNEFYFMAVKEVARRKKHGFVDDFIALLIDLFNVKTALRAAKLTDYDIPKLIIPGGRFRPEQLETEQQALEQLVHLGGEQYWKEAIAEYQETGDFSLIEKVSDELIMKFLKERSYSLFSPVPLFSYFTAMKQNVQFINGVIAEKEAGLSEGEIRHIFRAPS